MFPGAVVSRPPPPYAKTDADFWAMKVARNRVRDDETDVSLRETGWTVLRFWEHEPAVIVAERIIALQFGVVTALPCGL